jgi:hypothetical protein
LASLDSRYTPYNLHRYSKDEADRFELNPDSGIYTPRTAERRPPKPEPKFRIFGLRPYQWATLALSVATLGFLISYTQAAWKTVCEVERQTRLDERPWIRAITPLALPDHLSAGAVAHFPICVRSLGKTPAQDIDGKIAAEIVREDQSVSLAYGPSIEMKSGIMFPTQEQKVDVSPYTLVADKNVIAEPRPVTKEEVSLLTSGRAEVFIYGEFTFSDVFGTNHWYRFCVAQSPKQERTQRDWGAKQSCGKYNGTDNN